MSFEKTSARQESIRDREGVGNDGERREGGTEARAHDATQRESERTSILRNLSLALPVDHACAALLPAVVNVKSGGVYVKSARG